MARLALIEFEDQFAVIETATMKVIWSEKPVLKKTRRKNISQYKGVSQTPSGRWTAQFCINGTVTNLGLFPSERAAAVAYDIRALAAGKPVNFPVSKYSGEKVKGNDLDAIFGI
jgi:hypothetical protein